MKPYKVISHETGCPMWGDGCWDVTRRGSLAAAFSFAKRYLRGRHVDAVQIVDTRNGRVWPLKREGS